MFFHAYHKFYSSKTACLICGNISEVSNFHTHSAEILLCSYRDFRDGTAN